MIVMKKGSKLIVLNSITDEDENRRSAAESTDNTFGKVTKMSNLYFEKKKNLSVKRLSQIQSSLNIKTPSFK